jgi:AcrR family transcriptional regulator
VIAVDARVFGRPRSPAVDAAILRAAVELCAEEGFEGTTVEAVANRAGVGKATVYRRYPNRVGLVLAVATEVCRRVVDDVDTGSVLEDLRLVAHGIARNLESHPTCAVLAQIASGAARHPELRAAQRRFVATRRAVAIEAIRRGIARGELRSDTDPELMTDLVTSPLFHRAISLGEPVDVTYADALVETVVKAFAGV